MINKINNAKYILLLQLTIILYTTSGIMAKKASFYKVMSKEFIVYYFMEILILGVYAIIWQQVIKKFDISVAYSNKGIGMFWSLIWAVLFFNEHINYKNIIGALVIFIGIMMVNKNE